MRWRIAVTTAGLTLADPRRSSRWCSATWSATGSATTSRTSCAAPPSALAAESSVAVDPVRGPVIYSPQLNDSAMADDAVIRIVDEDGRAVASTDGAVR